MEPAEYNTKEKQFPLLGLKPCTKYLIAVAVNLKSLNDTLLYVDVTGDTGGYHEPQPEFYIEVADTYLRWQEDNACTQKRTQQLMKREVFITYLSRAYIYYEFSSQFLLFCYYLYVLFR